MTGTVYALRAFYPDWRVAIVGTEKTSEVLAQDESFYRNHANAARITRHVLHREQFAVFADCPADSDAGTFARWALTPEGYAIANNA